MAARSARHAIKGSERPRSERSRLIEALGSNEELSVTFILRSRPDGPALPDLEYWQRTPPHKRVFLSPAEFAEKYGASPSDMDAVSKFAEANGLTVLEKQVGPAVVIARGTAAQMNAAFGITLNRYESPRHVSKRPRRPGHKDEKAASAATQVHRGFDGPVQIPAELAGIVTAVFGLDNRILGGTNGTGDPAGSVSLDVPTLAQLYNFPNTGAANQTIGIFNGNGNSGNYDPKDIQDYINSLPAGYQTQPTINEVDLKVDGTTFKNDPSGSLDDEITQDIETATAVAQGVTVQVYCSTSNEDGWRAFLGRVMSPQGSENTPTVCSSSWFINSRDDSASTGQGLLDTLSGMYAKLAPLGISIFIASGDEGANSGIDTSCHVQYPGSDPWVTSCGGTMVSKNDGPPVSIKEEWVWSDENSGWGATGGGVSDYFAAPSYQTANGVSAVSLNDNKVRRGVPDIAGMVALTGLRVGGGGFSFTGTSCVDPLYAGLTAVLAEALGEPIGFLNPTLYALGNSVCNDITFGNNDPNFNPDSPFYVAGAGWDACTGWGSVDGTKLLNAFQQLYKKSCSFILDRSTFGKDEVDVVSTYTPAFWVLVEGFRPSELGLTAGNLSTPPIIPQVSYTLDPSLTATQNTAIQNMLSVSQFAGPVVPEDPSLPNLPQGFLFPFTISFSGDQGFVDLAPLTSTLVTLSASVTAASNTVSGTAQIDLGTFEDPFFIDVNPKDPSQPSWLSFDLRFFKMTVPAGKTASRFGATMTDNPNDAPGFIAAAIHNLTQGGGTANGDTFDPGLSQDEDASALEFQQQDDSGNYVFNFAVARVRLLGKTPGAQAQKVRVFFRLFQAQTTNSDFNTSTTYRFQTDGLPYGVSVPLLGVESDQNGNPEYVTIPFFATARNNIGGAANMQDQPEDTPNAYTITVDPNVEVDSFFGCWLDINQPEQKFLPSAPPAGNWDGPWTTQWSTTPSPLQSIQEAITAAPHQCLIAEIRFDDTPIPAGANSATSDKLAQRNIAWIDGPNPGLPSSRRMSHPVQIRPTPFGTVNPDELMIFWGATPAGSQAQLYLPALNANDILNLADARYSTHGIQFVDAHTVTFTTGGVTFIPLPQGTALAAGLLAVDLPPGIHKGDIYKIIVRQVTDAVTQVIEIAGRAPRAAGLADYGSFGWRRVAGAFQFTITISTKQQLLLPEERLLALMRWIWEHMPPQRRWYPVLQRYIGDLVGRVQGFGGNPAQIPPSETGQVPGLGVKKPHPIGEREVTGKIAGIVYDHFGDFVGFVLEDEWGHEHHFESREKPMLNVVQRAWEQRARVRVTSERHRERDPRRVILLI
ncbi:MAG TPA: S53 family peptidase [Bryobacteraceae bacterium]|nr:S53 family peptidase [Bryobacteraceae bacterium]